MRRNGQALIWGIAMILIAAGMTLFIDGFVNQLYISGGAGFSLIYVNGTLEQRVDSGVMTNVTGETPIPSADYNINVACEGPVCTHTYLFVSNRPTVGLVEYIIASILILFGGLGFYMAQRSM
jgi:hypothetical protein